jgi:hypothetical protein
LNGARVGSVGRGRAEGSKEEESWVAVPCPVSCSHACQWSWRGGGGKRRGTMGDRRRGPSRRGEEGADEALFPALGRRNLDALGGLHVVVMVAGLAPLYGNGRKEARGLGVPWRVEEYRVHETTRVPRGALASGGSREQTRFQLHFALCSTSLSQTHSEPEYRTGFRCRGIFCWIRSCCGPVCIYKPGRPCHMN